MKTNYKEQIDPELRDNIRNFPFNMTLVKIGRAYQETAYRKADVPDLEALPDDEPIGEYKGGDSFSPMQDYMEFFQNPAIGGQSYCPIIIEKKA